MCFCGFLCFREVCCLCLHLKVIKEVTRLCGQGYQACGYSEPGHGKKKWKSLDQANRKGVMEMEESDLRRKAKITEKQQWNEIL